MEKYDILKSGALDELAKGMAGTAWRNGLFKFVGRGKEEPGKQTDYSLQGMEEVMEETVVLGDVELQNCILTASATQQIVKTAINGVPGTVKEWFSAGDVAIGMTVTLLNADGNEYPWDQVKVLKEVLNRTEALDVVSRWLNEVWGVTRVVVESYNMTGRTDRNYEVVELNMASDMDYIIAEEVNA